MYLDIFHKASSSLQTPLIRLAFVIASPRVPNSFVTIPVTSSEPWNEQGNMYGYKALESCLQK